ncbi:CatB-related O-acetyltransferase [Edwardsiella tarda]
MHLKKLISILIDMLNLGFFKRLFINIHYIYKYKTSEIRLNATLNNVILSDNNIIGRHVYLSDVIIGKYSYISDRSRLSNVEIGAFVSIGPDCRIGLGIHPVGKNVSTHPIFYSSNNPSVSKNSILYRNFISKTIEESKRICIGSDVWIGANVIIMDGVNIGNGAVIAAGAVVTRDVKNYELVGGVPAKHIRFRFCPEDIIHLNNIAWWEKNDEDILENINKFDDINSFL